MSVRPLLLPLALGLIAAGCSDEIGLPSTAVQPPIAEAPHFLRWAGRPQFSTIGTYASPAAHAALASSSAGGISLDHYSTAFWAVRGEQRFVQINYLSSTGDTSSSFLRLTNVDPVYVPGRGYLALGDSVLITVTIDPDNVAVSLEPTGLLFGDPAQLQISYAGADGDLNGDGVVDDADARIESQLLGMLYREGPDDEWTRIPAGQSLSGKTLTSLLQHFSEYAVSW